MSVSTPHSVAANEDACVRGARQLVRLCAGLEPGERAYVVANPVTADVADLVARAVDAASGHCRVDIVPEAAMHGADAPDQVARAMLEADVVFCLTRMSLAHSAARLAASERGVRFLSLPDYSLEQLASPALQFDFLSIQPLVDRLGDVIDRGRAVRITTPRGTELSLDIGGRNANRCPGFVHAPGTLGSSPDAEVNVAPLEECSEGRIVIDGSIPCREIGVLTQPVTLLVEHGAIVAFESDAGAVVEALTGLLEAPGSKRRVLAEFGIGLNPLATLCGRMLEDEGCAETVHFGFGSNATIGGRNAVPFHLDFIMRGADVWIDDRQVLKNALPIV